MKNEEILNEQTGGSLNTKQTMQLIEREKVEGTPFHIITTEENGSFIAMNQWKITDDGATKEELRERIANKDWETIVSTMFAVVGMCDKAAGRRHDVDVETYVKNRDEDEG